MATERLLRSTYAMMFATHRSPTIVHVRETVLEAKAGSTYHTCSRTPGACLCGSHWYSRFLSPLLAAPVLITAVLAATGAAAGVWISAAPEVARRAVPISGFVLLLLAFLFILPELGETFGWAAGLALLLVAYGAVWSFDRWISPVCPACSHSHDHRSCDTRLHGFATPLICAALIHSVFDGWALVASRYLSYASALDSLALGVLLHKLPESIAYGVILRAALPTRTMAMGWALAAQLPMFVGVGLAAFTPTLSPVWMGAVLAVAGGLFLFLGMHAVHGVWKRHVVAKLVRTG